MRAEREAIEQHYQAQLHEIKKMVADVQLMQEEVKNYLSQQKAEHATSTSPLGPLQEAENVMIEQIVAAIKPILFEHAKSLIHMESHQEIAVQRALELLLPVLSANIQSLPNTDYQENTDTAEQLAEIMKPALFDSIQKIAAAEPFYTSATPIKSIPKDQDYTFTTASSTPCATRSSAPSTSAPSAPTSSASTPNSLADVSPSWEWTAPSSGRIKVKTSELAASPHHARWEEEQFLICCAACSRYPSPATSVQFGREDGTYEAKKVSDLLPDPPYEHLGEHILCFECN